MADTTNGFRFHETGGPDVLRWETIALPEPHDGEIRLRHTAISVNFIDTNQRKGAYPVKLPSGLGLAGVGVAETAGGGFQAGDRVGYATGPLGAYQERRNVETRRLVRLPDDITDQDAAALMMRGLTAWYLIHKTYAVKPGDAIVVHAAAGGVGQIAARWAKAKGAFVIGLVGSEAKTAIAKQAGCDNVLISREPFATNVRALTGGKGVAAVYDSVGKDTFMESLDCLAVRGVMAAYGTASGPIPMIDPKILADKGGLFLTRPSLIHYVNESQDLEEGADAMFAAVRDGIILPNIQKILPLKDAAEAHRMLEARETTGALVLIP